MKINFFFFSLLLSFFFIVNPHRAIAQSPTKVNPLTTEFSDVLIPKQPRELRDFERKRIEEKITELDELAHQQLKEEKGDDAFILWYQAINLSRYLGVKQELEIINKIGQIAWDNSRNEDINFFNERLNILENQLIKENSLTPEITELFLQAYETIRNLDKAIMISQKQLELARNDNNNGKIKLYLDKLGNLYLAKFDYFNAEPIYRELLTISRANQDYLGEGIYLQKLAEISQALVNPENSIKYKEELAKTNFISQNLSSLAMLKIAIGNDYKTLNKPELASKSYQDAFSIAWSLQQYAIAGDALKNLGKLYQEYEQLDSALQIYQELIAIEQQSYNLYGLMNTYDYIGVIYAQKEQYNQAKNFWQKSLEIARHLKYKEDYFLNKIATLNGE